MNIAHIKYLWKRDFTKSNKSLNKGSAPFIYTQCSKNYLPRNTSLLVGGKGVSTPGTKIAVGKSAAR